MKKTLKIFFIVLLALIVFKTNKVEAFTIDSKIPNSNVLISKQNYKEEDILLSNGLLIADNTDDVDDIRDICESSGFLKILSMLLTILTVLKLAVPLILIVMLIMEIYPLISNPGEVSKALKNSKNKIIAAVLVFFVPTIMEVVLDALGDSTSVSTCYEHAKDKDYIKARKEAEKNYFGINKNGNSGNSGSNGGGSTYHDDGGFDSRSGGF